MIMTLMSPFCPLTKSRKSDSFITLPLFDLFTLIFVCIGVKFLGVVDVFLAFDVSPEGGHALHLTVTRIAAKATLKQKIQFGKCYKII